MSVLDRLFREPALILGLATSALGLLTIFGVDLTEDQVGAILVFLGAVIALLRFITTPTSEVISTQRGDGAVRASAKAEENWGIRENAVVHVTPVNAHDSAY